jgi:hypothetical protein
MSEVAEPKVTNFFDQLVKNCDCPIRYHNFGYWQGYYNYKAQSQLGFKRLDGEISISSILPHEGKEGTLIHEMGHHWHHKRIGTSRYENMSVVLDEIIAELYALHLLLKNKQRAALKYRFSTYEECWRFFPHLEALKVIKCRRIWKRCKQFLKEG